MAETRFSINDEVKFKLTKDGIQSMHKHVTKYDPIIVRHGGPILSINDRMPKKDRDGYFRMQLWEVIQIFGPDIFMGGSQIFINNELIF